MLADGATVPVGVLDWDAPSDGDGEGVIDCDAPSDGDGDGVIDAEAVIDGESEMDTVGGADGASAHMPLPAPWHKYNGVLGIVCGDP